MSSRKGALRACSRQIVIYRKNMKRYADKKMDYEVSHLSVTSLSQKNPDKSGFLKRFLEWIARGADKSNISGRACPS